MSIDECVKEAQNHNAKWKASHGRSSRGTGSSFVAPLWRASRKRRKRCKTVWDTHCSERGSQVHPDIQYGTCDHFPQCEISVQCTDHYRGCGGSQQAIQGGKHARLFSNVAEFPQCNGDRLVPGLLWHDRREPQQSLVHAADPKVDRWQPFVFCFEELRQECHRGPSDKQYQKHLLCERSWRETRTQAPKREKAQREECNCAHAPH